MATQFLDKKYGTNSSTALADDTTGTRKVRNLPDAAGIVYDSVDGFIKYNDAGNIRTLVNTNEAQTLSSKTLSAFLYTDLTEVVAAANVITAAESGSVFFLNSATEFASTLPAPAAGLHFTFIVTAAPSGADYTITTNGSSNIILGQAYTLDVNSATDPDFEVTGCDTISFVSAKAVVGDRVEIYCDGTNWFAYGFSSVFDAITFTTAS